MSGIRLEAPRGYLETLCGCRVNVTGVSSLSGPSEMKKA